VSLRTRTRSAVAFVSRVVAVVREENVTFLAASVAYYAFVSLLPGLALVLVAATTLGGDALAARVIELSGAFLTERGRAVVREALGDGAGQGSLTAVGAAVLLWGMLKVFRALDTAFSDVYDTEHAGSLLDQLIDSAVVVLAIGLGVALMLALGTLVVALEFAPLATAAGILFLPVLLTVAFLPMYYRFPDTRVTLREAIPGAVVAAVGWAVLQALFQLYASVAGRFELYGVVGAVLLLVTWFYLAAIVLLVGAVVNAILSDRQLQQAPGRRSNNRMSEDTRGADDRGDRGDRPRAAPDLTDIDERVADLRADLEAFEAEVEERTVDRPRLKAELERYVRRRTGRGHARGWGPYLVLLYGVVLTLGAFRYIGSDLVAVGAMIVIFLSTLGLYALFVLVGAGLNALGLPRKAVEAVRNLR
jgi:YihY family inner membrane protein